MCVCVMHVCQQVPSLMGSIVGSFVGTDHDKEESPASSTSGVEDGGHEGILVRADTHTHTRTHTHSAGIRLSAPILISRSARILT